MLKALTQIQEESTSTDSTDSVATTSSKIVMSSSSSSSSSTSTTTNHRNNGTPMRGKSKSLREASKQSLQLDHHHHHQNNNNNNNSSNSKHSKDNNNNNNNSNLNNNTAFSSSDPIPDVRSRIKYFKERASLTEAQSHDLKLSLTVQSQELTLTTVVLLNWTVGETISKSLRKKCPGNTENYALFVKNGKYYMMMEEEKPLAYYRKMLDDPKVRVGKKE